MLVEDIIDYYNDNLTFYKLVISKMSTIHKVLLILCCWVLIFILCLLFITQQNIYIIITLVFLLLVSFYFISICNKVIKKHYKEVIVKKYSWVNRDLDRLALNRLRLFLIDKSAYSTENLKLIASVLEKKIDEDKIPVITILSSAALILGPVWISLVSQEFSFAKNDEELFKTFFWRIFGVAILLVFLVYTLRASLLNMLTKNQKFKKLLSYVYELQLSCSIEENKKNEKNRK